MILQDAPGGPALIESLIDAARTWAVLFASTGDAPALLHLQSYLASIEPALVEAIGPGPAAKVMEAFRGAVMAEKHKLESGGSSRC